MSSIYFLKDTCNEKQDTGSQRVDGEYQNFCCRFIHSFPLFAVNSQGCWRHSVMKNIRLRQCARPRPMHPLPMRP